MGDYAYLTMSDSVEEFECKYWIPLLWEPMFVDEELQLDDPDDDGIDPDAQPLPRRSFATDRLSALSRLGAARADFLDRGPAVLACYDTWRHFLETSSFRGLELRGAVINYEPGWLPSNRDYLDNFDQLLARDSGHFAGMMFGYSYTARIEVPELQDWKR